MKSLGSMIDYKEALAQIFIDIENDDPFQR